MRISAFVWARLMIVTALFWCNIAFSQNDTIFNASQLISSIHKRYSSIWYEHLSFKQEMFNFRDDSIVGREVWNVAYSYPSRLHIRYNDFDSGRGWVIVRDTIFSFNHFKLIGSRFLMHETMFLGLDMYLSPVQQSIEKAIFLGLNLDKFVVTYIKGKRVYQIGDENRFCFWVYADNLLFYGVRKVNEKNDIRETFFEAYKNVYGKPVATEVHYFINGKLFRMDRYFEIRLPTYLHPDIYNPLKVSAVRW